MIRYTREAQIGRAHLLRAYNDLLVFVEDATCQNMHVRILSRILGGAGKISNVFPLYGRENVVEAALQDDGQDPRRLYLIDGDLDQLTDRQAPNCPHLYRLGVYSIENLLLTESSIVEIAAECAVDEDRKELMGRIDFPKNKELIIRYMLSVFELYAVVARLNLPIETISFSVSRLFVCSGKTFTLSPIALANRRRTLRTQIVRASGWAAYKREIVAVQKNSKQLRDQSKVLSGKDYLLPIVHAYLRVTLNLRDSFNGFRVRLANHFDPNIEPDFREFVHSVLATNFRLRQQ